MGVVERSHLASTIPGKMRNGYCVEEKSNMKVRAVMRQAGKGGWKTYRSLVYGDVSLWTVCWAEFLAIFVSGLAGAAGLVLRSKLYRPLFGAAGKKVVIGRNCSFRHAHKIQFGQGAIVDDHCLVDAKGETNKGIVIGDDVYIGRNSSIYCKNGDIALGDQVNISSSCTIMSSNRVQIGRGTVVGAYCYLLSGGEYDYRSDIPFADQSGTESNGVLSIGENCWLGARVTVLDGASIGDHCVIGAGAVVTSPIPSHSIAFGVPAKVVKRIR
jgi:acetyltransferase-like isoleucine patch superfamily enzyme